MSNENLTPDESLAKNGESFHWAKRFLGKKMGTDAAKLYAFCRLLDDMADGDIENGPERLKLLGIALKNIIINQKLKTCITTLNHKELEQCNYKKGDYEGFVNYGLSIKNIELSIILIEEKKESQIKMSFRSKGNITVNDFAKKYFNGGGHKNAAGGISKDSLKKTIELVNKHLESFLKNS